MNPRSVGHPAVCVRVSRLVTISIVMAAACAIWSGAEAQQSCPGSSSTQHSGRLTLKQQATYAIDLEPCQTVVVLLTASASTHAKGTGNITLQIRNAASQELASSQISCGMTCNTTVPLASALPGYPLPGTRGTEGLAKDLVIAATVFNFFGGPAVNYTLTINKGPRTDYNTGGTAFGNAPTIETRTEQVGTVHPLEPGQYYKVHLDEGQLIFVRGQASAHSTYGAQFVVALHDASQIFIKNMVNVAPYGTVTFPTTGTGPVHKNTGAAGDFYLRVYTKFWPTWDFRITVATPTLTASPSSVGRGANATFTIEDAPGGTYSGWQYATQFPVTTCETARQKLEAGNW